VLKQLQHTDRIAFRENEAFGTVYDFTGGGEDLPHNKACHIQSLIGSRLAQ
jgi:hypothetical protein